MASVTRPANRIASVLDTHIDSQELCGLHGSGEDVNGALGERGATPLTGTTDASNTLTQLTPVIPSWRFAKVLLAKWCGESGAVISPHRSQLLLMRHVVQGKGPTK